MAPRMNRPHRVLHLIDPIASGHDAAAACLLAARRSPLDHAYCIIGTSDDERRARILGLSHTMRILPCMGRPELAARSLTRLIKDHDDAGLPPSIVHAWSRPAFTLARLAAARSRPCTATLLSGPRAIDRRIAAWISTVPFKRSPHPVTAISPEIAAAWAGLVHCRPLVSRDTDPPPSATASDAHKPPTPHDPALRADLRRRLREDLRIPIDARAVALIGEPAAATDARRFVFLLALLAASGSPALGIVSSRARHLRRAARFTHAHGHRWRLLTWDGPLQSILHACDSCVWDAGMGRGEGPMMGPVSLAAGVQAGHRPIALDSPVARAVADTLGHDRVRVAGHSFDAAREILSDLGVPPRHPLVRTHHARRDDPSRRDHSDASPAHRPGSWIDALHAEWQRAIADAPDQPRSAATTPPEPARA